MDTLSVINRLRTENPKPFSEIVPQVPGTTIKKFARWAKQGFQTRDGRVVRLEAILLPHRMLTSLPAVIRFLEAVNGTPSNVSTPRPPSESLRAARKAELELQAIGC